MSYTYLQEQGEESSAASFSDIPASALSSLTPTDEKCCCNGSETECSQGSPSGMTSEPSTVNPGAGESMLSAEGSLARGSALPAMAPDSTTRKVDCGASRPESLATFDPVSCSLKTRQHSLFEAGCELLATLPRWGMIVGGELYPLPTPSGLLELRAWITSASASGSMERLPTICAADAGHNGRGDLYAALNNSGRQKRVPTPRSEDGQCAGGHRDKDDTLYGLICRPKRLPTPKGTAIGPDFARVNRPQSGGDDLATAIARMPTPDSRCWKSGSGRTENGHSPQLEAKVGGQLNPEWVEWLQGWPIGWTDLKPLAMGKFRRWLLSHGAP